LSIDRNRKLKESESEDDDDDDDEDSALSRVVIPAPRSEVVDADDEGPQEEHRDTNGWYFRE